MARRESFLFQSTLSVRRATGVAVAPFRIDPHISIHALREESDLPFAPFADICIISIHALREESDRG